MERNKQNKHVVCKKDIYVNNGISNVDSDTVDNGDDDWVDNGNDSANKHLTPLSQPDDCCLIDRSKQNKHVICNKYDEVDNGVDNVEDDSVDNADDG
eukprot:10156640-Ditylum_brightwellii.AAC.1